MVLMAPAPPSDVRGAGLFALPPSSPPQFLGYDRLDLRARPTSYRDRPSGPRGRGTSLERTEKERRVQISPNGAYASNAGDTALASPPASRRSPTPSDVIARNPPTEGVRASYRAWRYPLPSGTAEKAWSIGERGDDHDQGGRVEKLITEAMAGVEPNNRSRKASHSLGFFKEGLPEDRSKKRDARGGGRSKDGTSPIKSARGLDIGKRSGPDIFTRDLQRVPESDTLLEARSPSTVEGGLPASLPVQLALDLSRHPAEGGHGEPVHKQQIKAMPPQLLAEIRKHHNLTPGATKGTSFSRSLPVAESERPRDEDVRTEPGSAEPNQNDGESNDNGAELSPVKSADDDDESGEEQISSAIFLPHQSSHDSSEREHNVFESVTPPRVDDQRHPDVSSLQRWLEEYEVPARDLVLQESSSRTIPISSPVRVKQPSIYADRGSVVSEPGDVSGAEQEILDDSGYTTAGEDDSNDLTPVGSVKPDGLIASGYNRHVADEQQDPKRPLEAIELIPYRHQVGGHTTMWRFSKRAVCKQLTNRENEFYEKVERYHPQLLKFLPRFV